MLIFLWESQFLHSLIISFMWGWMLFSSHFTVTSLIEWFALLIRLLFDAFLNIKHRSVLFFTWDYQCSLIFNIFQNIGLLFPLKVHWLCFLKHYSINYAHYTSLTAQCTVFLCFRSLEWSIRYALANFCFPPFENWARLLKTDFPL